MFDGCTQGEEGNGNCASMHGEGFFPLPLVVVVVVVVAAVEWQAAAWRKEGGGFLMEGWLAWEVE